MVEEATTSRRVMTTWLVATFRNALVLVCHRTVVRVFSERHSERFYSFRGFDSSKSPQETHAISILSIKSLAFVLVLTNPQFKTVDRALCSLDNSRSFEVFQSM